MTRLARLLTAAAVLAAAPGFAADDAPDKAYEELLKQQAKLLAEMGKSASHEQVAEVAVKAKNGAGTIQTLCLDGAGRVLALVAPPRGYGAPTKDAAGQVHVFTPAGEPVAVWDVPFHAHAINAGPDGTVYVAGDAKVARFDRDGQPLGEPLELPHVAELIKDEAAMRAKAEARLKKEKESMGDRLKAIRKQFEEKLKAIEEKKEADRSKTETRQAEQYRSILKSYEESEGYYAKRTVEDVLKELTARVRIVNGVAASGRDVFVACGETDSYGYAVWRFDPDLKNPIKVLGELGGCCGQMDVQCCGDELLVAENTKHQFARYSRDGKKVGGYGKRGQGADPAGFGGCCNPMNVRACGGGDVLTAESEGAVKRFSASGEFLGVVGTVKVQGGCKNVAVGVSADGGKVYFCDQPGSRFFILARRSDRPTDAEKAGQ